MSWQANLMIEQDKADALEYMGEAEWREMCQSKEEHEVHRNRFK